MSADPLREALAELVACKDMKDDARRLRSDPYYTTAADVLDVKYERRRDAAWTAARAALAAAPVGAPREDINDRRDIRDTFGGETDCAARALAATPTDPLREALTRIKGAVVGDAQPRWPVDMQVTYMRGWIADVCDAALAAKPAEGDESSSDFDAWQANPYTKVLQKSIDEDYVPRGASLPDTFSGQCPTSKEQP